MAVDNPTPPEGFGAFDTGGNDDDSTETVELSPGESLNGLVLSARDGENENGPWVRLKIKDDERGKVIYFAKGDVKAAYFQDEIEEGEPIWIAKTTDEESFENDDGEEISYNPTIVAFPEGDS